MCYLFNSRCLVVVSFDGFIDILGIQTDSQLAICFPGVASEDTQSVGFSTGTMIPCSMNLSSFSHTSGCIVIRHFYGACMTGFASLHRVMWYVPGKWPIPSNLSRYALMRSSFVLSSVGLMSWRFCLTVLHSVVAFFCWTNFFFQRLTAQLSSAFCCGFLLLNQCGAIVSASPQYSLDTFRVLSLTWIMKRHKLSEWVETSIYLYRNSHVYFL